jgi:HlyD family secretion protein
LLQVKIHVGEYATPGVLDPPLILIGNTSPMNVRVDVDEQNAWRVRAGTSAVAFVRGNSRIRVPLRFVRFEPYVIPKKSLTGDIIERVDTRVLQVIFAVGRDDARIHLGQQMDVFISASDPANLGAPQDTTVQSAAVNGRS